MKVVSLYIYLIFFLIACNSNDEKIPDIKPLTNAVVYTYLHDSIFNQSQSNVQLLKKNWGIPFECYYDYLMEFPDSTEGETMYHKFIVDTQIIKLYDTVKAHYPNNKLLQKPIDQCLSFYHHYFPELPIPSIVTCVSEFGPAAATCDSFVLISLDMYLGSDYPFYDLFDFPNYMQRKFEPEYIPSNIAKVLIKDLMPDSVGNRLIDLMVAEGVVMYVSQKLNPYMPDSINYGFSSKHLSWLKDNESQIWGFFLENKLLFKTDYIDIKKFVSDGPTTSGMPMESPGNVGSWIGLQIVKSYMRKFPNTSFKELLLQNDGQKILNKSKYKPS